MPGGQGDSYFIEVEGTLNFVWFFTEAYKQNVISKQELVHMLVQFLYQH